MATTIPWSARKCANGLILPPGGARPYHIVMTFEGGRGVGVRARIANILAAADDTPGLRPRRPGRAYAALKTSFPTRRP
jgi:hypothetical protein